MTVVLGSNPPPVREVVRGACAERGAAFVFAPDGVSADATPSVNGRSTLRLRTPVADYGEVTLGLRGRHQVDNAVVAVRLLEALTARRAFDVPTRAIVTGLTDVLWPGRLEVRSWQGTEVLIDGAHNPAAARALSSYLRETYARRVPIVFAAMRDKNVDAMIGALAPAASCLICTAPDSARAATPASLAAAAHRVAPDLETIDAASPVDALARARPRGAPIVVAGSLYLAGEVRAALS